LLRFVHADYPKDAERQGLQGEVVLKLTIDTEGNVTESVVEVPGGHGFDEAARAAALHFRFEPAKRDGVAVASRILFRYGFTLGRHQVKQAARKDGELRGQVKVGASAISGASVAVRGPSGITWSGVTDATGHWHVPGLEPATYRVTVTAAGYASQTHEERVAASEATDITYTLAPASDGFEVVITGEALRSVSRHRLTRQEIVRIPGTNGDPIRALESLPGVARAPAGTLVIRGSSPLATGLFIDGMAIPYLFHVYELSSVVPADLVDTVDLYPGNYSTRYGRYIGGIVEVGLRSPNTQCLEYGQTTDRHGCYHGMAQFDWIDGRLLLEGPVPLLKGWSFMLSGRRSWIDVVMKEAAKQTDVNVIQAPHYDDWAGILEYKDERRQLRLRGLGASDSLELVTSEKSIGEDPRTVGLFRLTGGFERGQALYRERINSSVQSSSMFGIGRDHIALELGEISIAYRATPVAYRHELALAASSWFDLHLGADLWAAPYELTARYRPSDTALTPLEDKFTKGTDQTLGGYAEAVITPTQKLTIVPGLRIEHSPMFDELNVSPRLSSRYDLISPRGTPGSPHWQRRTTIKAGSGLHYQPPSLLMFGFDARRPDQHSERASQYSVGVEQELTAQLETSVEGFWVESDRLLWATADTDGNRMIQNGGTRRSIGLEFMLRYRPDKRFFGWISYTLSRSVTQDDPTRPEHIAQFDQTHRLNLVASLKLGRGWEMGGRFRYITGSPVTNIVHSPYAAALLDGLNGVYQPQYGAPFSDRLPDTHQLDIRVDKRWQFRAWALSMYLDVRNVYNHPVVDAYAYNSTFTQRKTINQLPLYPSLGVRGEF
jgi:TonB family protein